MTFTESLLHNELLDIVFHSIFQLYKILRNQYINVLAFSVGKLSFEVKAEARNGCINFQAHFFLKFMTFLFQPINCVSNEMLSAWKTPLHYFEPDELYSPLHQDTLSQH